MAESEKSIMHAIMRAVSNTGARVFRNHIGVAYQGEAIRVTHACTVAAQPGDVLIRQARKVRAGLTTGSSDLIGWIPRPIKPADVGRTIAQFVAIEVKSSTGRVERDQQQFIDVVTQSGGIAIVARSADEAVTLLT